MSFVSSLSSLPHWGLSLAIKFDQSMSGTLKSPVTMKLGRVSFGCGIFCRAPSSCCKLKVLVSGGR